MAAAKKSARQRAPRSGRTDVAMAPPATGSARRTPAAAAPRRNTRPLANPPAVAPCSGLEALQSLSPENAVEHVAAYLRDVMSSDEASAFEACTYRWELHLVPLDEFRLVRGIDLDATKLRRYRRALARGDSFPPVVGLGGDGDDATRGVLLCDGYHRAVAMRDAGIHYVWAWLATGIWQPATTRAPSFVR